MTECATAIVHIPLKTSSAAKLCSQMPSSQSGNALTSDICDQKDSSQQPCNKRAADHHFQNAWQRCVTSSWGGPGGASAVPIFGRSYYLLLLRCQHQQVGMCGLHQARVLCSKAPQKPQTQLYRTSWCDSTNPINIDISKTRPFSHHMHSEFLSGKVHCSLPGDAVIADG